MSPYNIRIGGKEGESHTISEHPDNVVKERGKVVTGFQVTPIGHLEISHKAFSAIISTAGGLREETRFLDMSKIFHPEEVKKGEISGSLADGTPFEVTWQEE